MRWLGLAYLLAVTIAACTQAPVQLPAFADGAAPEAAPYDAQIGFGGDGGATDAPEEPTPDDAADGADGTGEAGEAGGDAPVDGPTDAPGDAGEGGKQKDASKE